MNNNSAIEAAEAYIIEGIKNRDLGKVPLDPNVVFQGPLHEKPIYGVQALSDFLSGLYPIIKDCRIKKHVACGDEVCTMWDLELTKPPVTIPILEYFRLSQGKLVEVRPYYDPSPVTKSQ